MIHKNNAGAKGNIREKRGRVLLAARRRSVDRTNNPTLSFAPDGLELFGKQKARDAYTCTDVHLDDFRCLADNRIYNTYLGCDIFTGARLLNNVVYRRPLWSFNIRIQNTS